MSFDSVAIEVSAVSKRFELFERPSDQLKQFIVPRLGRMLGKPARQYFREFWALSEVSLTVRRGESCAIVGLNGSGKSTLLQIIAGTLTPTSGTVRTEGRVTALLELGSGFNPEFTGRENVRLNGALLGLTPTQISERMRRIEEFADIGEHFDRPLGTYSSGMQMRVAFAVATAFDPDILIVDEALAVGDAYFQRKCFHRLAEFKATGGTLLFVSHDAEVIKQLCDSAVLLNAGKLVGVGTSREIIDLYQGLITQKGDMGTKPLAVTQDGDGVWPKATTVTTNGDVRLLDVRLLDARGDRVTEVESESLLTVEYEALICRALDQPAFGLIVRDRFGKSIYEVSTFAMGKSLASMGSGERVVARFTFDFNLRAGNYFFSIGIANRGYARTEFEETCLLMHDVEHIKVTEAAAAPAYGGIFNMRPIVSVEPTGHALVDTAASSAV
ncbi:ABC transporter ATP-binding protein [Ramlibacter sp. AW1]|uniref:ABC transporter ATP-binding protein n=1 Tax=Ramlibacter aurantiacus TaxID=2801330 RepID=A0A936ZJX1_9BURK|nr:ABC transporter ATP-binding protein [Ramlibacter aurantiacus]MBL0422262.1 ABC transporter ATP-binding protein [Ramlibacter aurantiacus]